MADDVGSTDGPAAASRRGVLRAFLAAGAAAVAVGSAAPAEAKPKVHLVCRLRTRRTRACRACRIHHRYLVFLSPALADANRAHPGCDCPIVKQRISRRQFRRMFPDPSVGVFDLRRLPRTRR
jgi:hypothetical protein